MFLSVALTNTKMCHAEENMFNLKSYFGPKVCICCKIKHRLLYVKNPVMFTNPRIE